MNFLVICISLCVIIILDAAPYLKRNPEPPMANSRGIGRLTGPQQPLLPNTGSQYNLQHARDYNARGRLQRSGLLRRFLQNGRRYNPSFGRQFLQNPKSQYLKFSGRIRNPKYPFNTQPPSNIHRPNSSLEGRKYLGRRIKYNQNRNGVSSSLKKPELYPLSAGKRDAPQVHCKGSRRPIARSTNITANKWDILSALQMKQNKREVARMSETSGAKKLYHSLARFDLVYLLGLFLIFIPIASIFVVIIPIASFCCGNCKKRKRHSGAVDVLSDGAEERSDSPVSVTEEQRLSEEEDDDLLESPQQHNSPPESRTDKNKTKKVRSIKRNESEAFNVRPDNAAVDSHKDKDAYKAFVSHDFDGEGDTVARRMKVERWMSQDYVPRRKRYPRVHRNYHTNSANMESVTEEHSGVKAPVTEDQYLSQDSEDLYQPHLRDPPPERGIDITQTKRPRKTNMNESEAFGAKPGKFATVGRVHDPMPRNPRHIYSQLENPRRTKSCYSTLDIRRKSPKF